VLLVAGSYVLKHWDEIVNADHDRTLLTASIDAIDAERLKLSRQARARVTSMGAASFAAIDGRIAAIDQALQVIAKLDALPMIALRLPLPTVSDIQQRIMDQGVRKVRKEILAQERQYLLQAKLLVAAALDHKAAQSGLAELQARREKLRARHTQARNYIERLKSDHPIASELDNRMIEKINVLQRANNALVGEMEQVDANFLAQYRVLSIKGAPKALTAFAVDEKRLDNVVAELRALKNAADTATPADRLRTFLTPVIEALPAAFMILASGFLAHGLIKAFMFYVLAPAAARRPPVCIDPAATGAIGFRAGAPGGLESRPKSCGVSVDVTLEEGEEMLVLPDYVQGSVVRGNKDTQWLLDWSCPVTSLASGMYALTRIRRHAGENLVISSGTNPFSEIALVTLPDNSAMVFHPRGMVGVIYHPARPLRISRHWRLGSLHAWLTLQLRYLVFHGPVTLIVQGNRGVRVEPAGHGRVLRQNATLGFSADVQYSTIRCDTFFPFYRGKTPLLQDAFCGASGTYIYDETPIGSGQHGSRGKGLEGAFDTVLKVFGI